MNLLWTHRDQRLHVIDHNLAFEAGAEFGFWDEHVFRDSIREWTPSFQQEMTALMKQIVAEVPEYWREMPEEWAEVESGLTLEVVQTLLLRFEKNAETFWRRA